MKTLFILCLCMILFSGWLSFQNDSLQKELDERPVVVIEKIIPMANDTAVANYLVNHGFNANPYVMFMQHDTVQAMMLRDKDFWGK